MKKNILLGGLAAATLGLGGCDPWEALWEGEMNETLADAWSTNSKKSDLEDHTEKLMKSVLQAYLEGKIAEKGYSVSDFSWSSMTIDVGTVSPTLDLSNGTTQTSSHGTGYYFDWQIDSVWTPTMTLEGEASFKISGIRKTIQLSLSSFILDSKGKGNVWTMDDGAVAGELTISRTQFVADYTLAGALDETGTTSDSTIAEALVDLLVLYPIRDEQGW